MKKLIVALLIAGMIAVGCIGGGGTGPDKNVDNKKHKVENPSSPTFPDYRANVMIDPPHADYNKTFQYDSQMCWAVSACDALTNAGYAGDETVCMSYMMDAFRNEPGYAVDAIIFWFEDVLQWNSVPVWQDMVPAYQIDAIIDSINSGDPAVIEMQNTHSDIGHAITVYGYEHLAYGEADGFMYILKVVDGDDRYSGVVEWGFYWNKDSKRWECHDRDFALSHMYSILRNNDTPRGFSNHSDLTRGPFKTK